jgi:hypothetical protein
MSEKLPALPPKPIPTDVIKDIAMDIGKAVAAHIETMYPDAVKAASSTFLLSVRNTTYNEIMAALDLTNEDEIRNRLETRRAWRRQHKASWKRIREMSVVGEGKGGQDVPLSESEKEMLNKPLLQLAKERRDSEVTSAEWPRVHSARTKEHQMPETAPKDDPRPNRGS